MVSRRQLLTSASALLLHGLIPWTGRVSAQPVGIGRSVRFGVLADAHVDIHGINGWRMGEISVIALQNTVISLNSLELDFVLVPGDLLFDGEWENLQVAKSLLDSLTVPYFIISGNHDYIPADTSRLRKNFSYLSTSEFTNAFRDNGYDSSGSCYWSRLVVPGLRVIGLDGCLRKAKESWGGILPKEQLLWLDEELSRSSEPAIIMVHHCLLYWGDDEKSVRGRWHSLENSFDVRQVLEKHQEKVAMVISGHRHIGLRYRSVGGVNYFVVPSINSHPMRYSIFELGPTGINWQTPQVAVGDMYHQLARQGLLDTSWFTERNTKEKEELLSFYEAELNRTGVLQFDTLLQK